MRSFPRCLLALSAIAALGACSSDSSVAPVARPATLDGALGELSLSSVLSGGVATAMPGAAISLTPGNCAFNSVSQSFVCATVTAGGYTVSSSFTLLTASGGAQSAFDQATTAAVRSTSSVSGSQVFNGSTLVTDMTQTLTLSGLLTGVHTLNGTQLVKETDTPSGGVASTMTLATTIADLVLPADPTPGHYPKSGMITTTLTQPAQPGLPAYNFSMAVTFNGTSKVDVTITDAGITQHCTVDLAAKTPSCV